LNTAKTKPTHLVALLRLFVVGLIRGGSKYSEKREKQEMGVGAVPSS